ncbi:bifunctional 3'-5' exonuclease/DNA polymerase [Klugiella xanthotipulae]|uniref:DNA-directed DNA polymerase n=1 Tax=Klugiella xanthotipulae TaxID=244735 RepID=A0A543I5R6_9MICO|nr:bifunctional 3'-5' exonuclease/DNA polymerase [Klugiella xanthotipulae]TQM65927.1 DNA polymerase-1 [Klugiella xanthotipulae]
MVYILVSAPPTARGRVVLWQVDATGRVFDSHTVPAAEFPDAVDALTDDTVRWVWDDTAHWYPPLLERGIRVQRCHDLRLSHAILRHSAWTAGSPLAHAPHSAWDDPVPERAPTANTLFDDLDDTDGWGGGAGAERGSGVGGPDAGPGDSGLPSNAQSAAQSAAQGAAGRQIGAYVTRVANKRQPARDPHGEDESLREFRRQRAALAASEEPGRLGLLVAVESAGALIAAEMRFHGIPWRADLHDHILTEALGERPRFGGRPVKMEALVQEIRRAVGNPTFNPDSQPDLLRALRRAGLSVTSTSKWELRGVDHPVVAPLLAYKKMSRLYTANGWAWLDTWVRDGRFHPEYVVGGVVTGRWAAKGGGALQLPGTVRGAVVADPGWTLVVADAAQLEPRILSALSGDLRMAEAGRGQDLYQALVDQGVVDTRDHAKVGILGALYGSTTGQSAALMPRLTRAYPAAIQFVAEAARVGEKGGVVTTWLGRSSPRPDDQWWVDAVLDTDGGVTGPQRERAMQQARSWGRFTRNFVCQGSAAEWAMCWMAGLRTRLAEMGSPEARPHLVYFLHDEVMVHTPVGCAEEVVAAVHAAAADAGRLLFGGFPVEFPVQAMVAGDYAAAKG